MNQGMTDPLVTEHNTVGPELDELLDFLAELIADQLIRNQEREEPG